jgi:hypothetical protein
MGRLLNAGAALAVAAGVVTSAEMATAAAAARGPLTASHRCAGPKTVIPAPIVIGKQYCGTGSNILTGPIRLSKRTSIAWTNSGGQFMTITFDRETGPELLPVRGTKAASGTASVPAGFYVAASVLTKDHWTFTIK